ncbi:Uncharacterised protein [Mycobacteroides abscessus subsp. abscessus]|nr:Uncharacterised protein [Mycobacteroides abscessus subsp. abscessus]
MIQMRPTATAAIARKLSSEGLAMIVPIAWTGPLMRR